MNRDEALFVNLVMIFKSAAMQQLGKVVNPLTGKVERNLEQARFSIDTLAMLKDKTRGNLSEDLAKLLDSVLMELRMNFVEESRLGDTPPAASGAGEGDAGEAGAGGEGAGPDTGSEEAQNGQKAD
jgi:hypothetical protein